MAYADAADNVWTKIGPFVRVLVHELTGSFWIAALALHDLHEARLIWIAVNVDGYVGAVGESRVAVEKLRGLRPPPVLLGTVAIAARILFGIEANNRDGPPILGDAAGTTKPPSRAWREIFCPLLQSGIQSLRV